MPRVTAVVLNYNRADDTIACVESLRAISPKLEIVVVDNASADDSASKLAAALPDARLIVTERNLGYAGGNNVGIRAALDAGADYVLVINNDTVVVEPSFVEALRAALDETEGAGIAGPLVVHGDGSVQQTVLPRPSFRLAAQMAWRKRFAGRTPAEPVATAAVESVNGVCMLIRREALLATGGFDERYFMYGEEADLAARAEAAGWKTIFVPVLSIKHLHDAGEERGSSRVGVRANFVRFCFGHRGVLSGISTAALFLAAAAGRGGGEARTLWTAFRGLEPALRGRVLAAAVLERVLVPVFLFLAVVFLAFGSSFYPSLRHAGSGGKFAFLVLAAGAQAAALALAPQGRNWKLLRGAAAIATVAFLVVCAASAAWSVDPSRSVRFTLAFVLIAIVTLVGAPIGAAADGRRRRALVDALLAASAVIVVLSALTALADPSGALLRQPGQHPRFRGFLESPNTLGAYAFVVPLAAWRAAVARSRLGKGLVIALLVLYVFELLLSQTRVSILLAFALLALYGVSVRFGRTAVLIGGSALVLLVVAITLAAVTGQANRQDLPPILRPSTFSTLSGRTEAWSAAGKLIHKRSVQGYGIGTEEQDLATYRAAAEGRHASCVERWSWYYPLEQAICDSTTARSDRMIDFSGGVFHNSYLGLGVQLGAIVGTATVLALLAGLYYVGRRLRRGSDRLDVALFAASLGALVWAGYSTYLWNPGDVAALPFWLVFALALGEAGSSDLGD